MTGAVGALHGTAGAHTQTVVLGGPFYQVMRGGGGGGGTENHHIRHHRLGL